MSSLSVSVLCVASVTFCVGIYHFMLHAKLRERRVDLAFGLLCLTAAVYDIATACLYSSGSIESAIPWQRTQFVILAGMAIACLWFACEFIGRKFGLAERIISAYFLCQLAVTAVERHGLTLTAEPAVKNFSFLGIIPVTYYEVKVGSLTVIQGIAGLAVCIYIIVLLAGYFRKGHRHEAMPILLGLSLLTIGVINDAAVGWGLYKSIYIIEFSYLCLIACMGYALNNIYFETQHELHQTSEGLRQLGAAVNAAAESIVISDDKGTILYVNPAFEKMTGYAKDEVIGRNAGIVSSGKQDKAFYDDMWGVLSAGRVWRGRFVNRKKDGTLFKEDAVISPVHDKSGKIHNYVAVKRDVTQETILETQLRHSQKMEALGQLASGVAHDFTNMLAIIMGHSQLMGAKTGENEDLNEHLYSINEATGKMSALTGELLAFAHKKPLTLKAMNLNKVLRGMNDLLSRTVDINVDLTMHTLDEKIMVEIDPDHIEQVLMHLILNSLDAMPEGGHLTIETSLVHLSQKDAVQFQDGVREDERLGGKYAVLSISDTGCGMNEEVKSHVFEPFYSTKGKGRTTGLGLSTSYGIVAQHNGHIGVYSHPGKGTTFNIFLPVIDAAEESVDTALSGDSGKLKGVVVLVSEDEEIVRRTLVRILHGLGCSVIEASSSHEARAIFMDKPEEIDVLFTDVMMSGIGGVRLAEELRVVKPGLKVIYASGYPRNHLVKMGIMEDGEVFITKPLSAMTVVTRIEELVKLT